MTLNPGDIPAGLEFPAAVLALAGQLDVSWALMTFPSHFGESQTGPSG
jgi:hypothetical protein